MLRYIVKRVLMLIPVLFCVAFLIFTMMYFSRGDPATMILGDQATPEQLTDGVWSMGWISRFGSSLSIISGVLSPEEILARPITLD